LTPQARLSAAAEVLDQIARTRAPADAVLKEWGRAHRFAGSGDRRAVREQVYACLRGRARYAWRMDADDGRALVLGALAERDTLHEIETLFTGEGHAPAPLTDAERTRLHTRTEQPDYVRAGIPQWLAPEFERAFGADWIAEAHALITDRAPVDLRVNTLKATRESVEAELDAANVQYEPTHLSEVGLRLHPETDIHALEVFKEGRIEIQDESSQIAAWLSAAAPGMTVVDYCAGGGGKTLALATLLHNENDRHPGLVPGPSVSAEAQVQAGSHAPQHPNPLSKRNDGPRDKPGVTKTGESEENDNASVAPPFLFDRGRAGDGDVRRSFQDDARAAPTESVGARQHPTSNVLPTSPSPPSLHRGGRETLGSESEQGRLIACDVNPDRLAAIQPRLIRAGVTAELRPIGPSGQGTEDLAGQANLVFVDAPCSGSGTWRRAPEAPWRLTPDDLARLHALQLQILTQAATLVAPGGRLVYATCSILPAEDEATANAFATAHPQFRPLPIQEALDPSPRPRAGGAPNLTAQARTRLASLAGDSHMLRLSPRLSGTDGFFIALYQRTNDP
jgi:16S rRNA C967 or C1407 C5-methylase (RsmB/RsmF family)